MPVTPFHYPSAYIIYRFGGRLRLPGLIVGSMVPDLEIPAIVLTMGTQTPNRMVLHSLLGGATFGTLLAVAVTVWLYPTLSNRIFRVDKAKARARCRFSIGLVFSCLLGVVSHVLLDVVNHDYNPVFWPWLSIYETPSPITPLLGGALAASLMLHGLLAVLFIALFMKFRGNTWEKLLIE